MPTYRGNIGNLLQHWVLCDILAAASDRHTQIHFVDAHSMAPCASQRVNSGWSAHLFDCVRDQLPGQGTPYEHAWCRLTAGCAGYPNTAAFLTEVWRGRYSLVLCESDQTTAEELERWATEQIESARCVGIEVAVGDWRDRFRRPLSQPDALTFFSFDPDMFDQHGSVDPRKMGPTELECVVPAVEAIPGSVLVQLSTYSANHGNAQEDVRMAVASGLHAAGLQLMALVRTDGQMMSLVFGRSIDFASSVSSMPGRFDLWLGQVKAKSPKRSNGAA